MRYHWGLAVGHLYSHMPTSTSDSPVGPRGAEDDRYAQGDESPDRASDTDSASDMYETDNPELGLDDRDVEDWQDVETDSGSDDNGPNVHDPESEEDFATLSDG